MKKAYVYNLNLCKHHIREATIVLLSADPFRVPEIKRQFGGQIKEIAWKREYSAFLCYEHMIKYVSFEALKKSKDMAYPENFRALERIVKGAAYRTRAYGLDIILAECILNCNDRQWSDKC